MEQWTERVTGVWTCAWGSAMAALGVVVGVSWFDGTASVLVSGWFAASLPIALLAGLQFAAAGTDGPEGTGSSRGEVSGPEDWGMRSGRFPVYTSQSPEAGLTSRMRS